MNKDSLNEDNRKKLQEAAQRLGIPEDEVFKQIPSTILSLGTTLNPKHIGGFLKRMESGMSSEEVLKKQIADDPLLCILLGFFNKTQENSSQQQEATSSAVSCEVSKDDSKKSDEVSNVSTEAISIKPLETSSTASCQESTRGWSNENKELLKTMATLSKQSENEVVEGIPEDVLSKSEYLADYLTALIESLGINSCTNNNPPNDVATGSSHEMSNVASSQVCDLTGENPAINEDCN